MMRALHALLHPRSIAIVGASPDPHKVRGMMIPRLRAQGFAGAIYPVNPGYETIADLPAFADITDVPGSVDLAVIAVAAAQLVETLASCARKGVGAAVILSGLPGGTAGETIQSQIEDVARASGIIILGPNTLGFWNPGHNVAVTFAPPVETAEQAAKVRNRFISIVSHSGGIGLSIYDKCQRAGLGVRYVLTTGNEADLAMLETVDYLIEEGGTKLILLYLEGFKHPKDFAGVAEKAADRDVRIVVVKAGTSAAGERAAISHTAHMTGSNTAYDAMFQRYGIVRATDIDSLMAIARLLSGGRSMKGANALILSTGGGYGALFADACNAQGIGVPPLGPDMQTRLAATIPAYGTAANPVDLPGAYVLEDNGASLAKILDDFEREKSLDAVILCFNLDQPGRIERMRPAIGPALARLTKPALFYSPTVVAEDNRQLLAALGVHQYSLIECAQALAALHQISTFRTRWQTEAPTYAAMPPLALPETPWTLEGSLALLARYGLPLAPQRLVTSPTDACAAAAELGYPIALKIHSPDIAHKSDVGGVALHLADAAALTQAFKAMMRAVTGRAPDARIEGVLVQKMAGKGREFAIGVVRDPDFGPIVMLAAGGTMIEVLEDAAFAPLPLTAPEASRLIDRLKSVRLLGPLRGSPPADRGALEALLLAISRLTQEQGHAFVELEFNPVIVHPAGEGVTVVDFLITQSHEPKANVPAPA